MSRAEPSSERAASKRTWLLYIAGALLLGIVSIGGSLGYFASQIDLLYQVASGGKGDEFRYALLAEPQATNKLGQNALHVAVAFRREEILAPLLEGDVDINLQDNTGMTPLHVAALYGRRTCAQQLVDSGANLELRDQFGDTPLATAAVFGMRHVYELLLSRGADASVKNNDGRTPRELAAHFGQAEMVAFLDGAATESAPQ